MTEMRGLVCAYLLDGEGRGAPVGWPEVQRWTAGDGPIWIHFDARDEESERWLRDDSGLSAYVVDGLTASETRPHCDWFDNGILLILRGVNLNPGEAPEDMVSIRIWIEEGRVITTRLRKLMAVQDVRSQLETGRGPISPGHLVARLASRMAERMGPVIDSMSDRVALLEEQVLEAKPGRSAELRGARSSLVDLRRMAIALRRYIAPQRDALNTFSQMEEKWLDDRTHGRLREAVDRAARITEELDEVRDRSAVVQDELTSRISQSMENTMYVLTLVATVMLPLGFLTGLLGVNVGGIPGSDTPWAFWAVCGLLVAFLLLEVWLIKKLNWR